MSVPCSGVPGTISTAAPCRHAPPSCVGRLGSAQLKAWIQPMEAHLESTVAIAQRFWHHGLIYCGGIWVACARMQCHARSWLSLGSTSNSTLPFQDQRLDSTLSGAFVNPISSIKRGLQSCLDFCCFVLTLHRKWWWPLRTKVTLFLGFPC